MFLPSSALLEDTFTFLAWLYANDITPLGSRFLSPKAISILNPYLRAPDEIRNARRHDRGGKHGTTERETERIRFIHYLCEAAHLVALTGHFLKPTPRAARWLTLSTIERTRHLFEAGFLTPSRHIDDLWRAYRLPGWQYGSPHTAVAPLLDLLRAIPLDHTTRLNTISKMIVLPILDGLPKIEPGAMLADLLRDLAWLGVVHFARSTLRLTDLGAHLLDRADAPPLPPEPTAQPLRITSKLELIAPAPSDLSMLYELADYAELVRVKPCRVYRLDQARVQRAYERGATFASLVRFLENATGDALPQRAVGVLQQWADEQNRVALRCVTLLETRDGSTMETLARVRGIRACFRRTLSPRSVTVTEARVPTLIRQLKRYGFAPRVEFSFDDHPPSTPFDHATLAHLYVAASLGHRLPEFIPATYRVPYAVLAELEKQLSEHDRTVAAQLIEDCRAAQDRTDRRPPAAEGEQPPLPTESSRAILTAIREAIEQSVPIGITYYAVSHDETTTRIVEPFRIEWRGNTPYLVAYCQLRQDERVFRVDRILTIHPTT